MQTFMHYRKYNKQGQIESRGGMTVAVNLEGRNITYAIAQCSTKDNFCREQGRIKAGGRLKSQLATTLPLPDGFDEKSPMLVNAVKSYLHDQPEIKNKVKKLLAGGK